MLIWSVVWKGCQGLKKTTNPKKPRENTWSFSIHHGPLKVDVCRQFLLSLFKISVKKVRVIQSKIIANESFEEKRGSPVNRPRNISENVISLMGEHLKTIPHDESHYCKDKTNLLYFDNSMLNVKTLFEMFKEFYKEKTKSNLKMSYQTYHQYYQSSHILSVSQKLMYVIFARNAKIS